MMGVQSEMYESCCRPCSPIIWGDMPQTHRDKPIAEKRRELRLPSRPLATLRWSLWTYQGSTLGRTRAAAVRSQRSHFSSSRRDSVTCAAFHTVTDRVGKAPLYGHAEFAPVQARDKPPCARDLLVFYGHPMPLRACGFHIVLIISNPQIDTAFHGAALSCQARAFV